MSDLILYVLLGIICVGSIIFLVKISKASIKHVRENYVGMSGSQNLKGKNSQQTKPYKDDSNESPYLINPLKDRAVKDKKVDGSLNLNKESSDGS